MPNRRTYTTPSGRKLTDDEIERLAEEVATKDYDVEQRRVHSSKTIDRLAQRFHRTTVMAHLRRVSMLA